MKKETSKKSKLWLWLAAAAVLLVIAGVVLALVLPGQGGQQTPETVSSQLYWNVDRLNWIDETGLSTRTAGEDGLVHVRFAAGGELVELPIVDKQLVNFIDAMNVMGLVLDGDGVVIDALDPKTVATEVAKEVFVKKVEGNQLLLNTSLAMNGMDIYVNVTDATGIYDVDPDAEAIGQTAVPEIMDKVYVYANEAGETTDIFICERAVEAGVYWRVEKKYDSEKLCTSREPDENGVYTILFAHNGEQVELKCKDKALVNTIDAANNIYAEFALVLDEEGYIVDEVDVGLALKGIKECNNYDVTAVEGNSFTAVRNLAGSDKGKEYSNTWDESCDIFLMENGCDAEFVGQRVDGLKVGDRITVYTDLESNPILILVVNREVDSPMYYRLDKYSTKNSVTLRPKDANGYYVFEMACQGKTVKLRCKDDYVATRIEWRNPGMMGLELEGDVIVGLHPASCVSGWGTAWNNYYVASISDPIVTLINVATGNTYNRLLAEGAEVYDVTGNYGIEKGAVTTLQAGDLVTCGRNIADELTHVYVLQHYEKNAKLYYNMDRKYNATTKETNRTPDENGYYVFEMLCEGKQYTLKTKSKKMADWIDAQSTSMVALTVSGSTIKNAFTHVTAFEYGYRPVNYNYVRSINKADNTFFTYYYENDQVKEAKDASTGEYKVWKMAKDCVVYNVSAAYTSQRGEKTTLKVDDQIQTFARQDTGEIVMILVINRKVDSPLYWPVSPKYNSDTKQTTRKPDANGWYIFDLFVNGEVKQFKTQDKEIATKVDSYTMGFALNTKGDVILNAYPANVAKNVKTTAVSHYDITQIKGNELHLTRTRPLAGDYGKTAQITMYSRTKIYDVSNYAENRGAKATLSLGDRVSVYTNMDGKVEYIYINYKNTHEKGHISYCEHCDKEVLWEPYSQAFYETDGHYYIPADMTSWAQKQVGYAELKEGQEQFEIVLDLNGKTVTARNRLALVYSKFTILDTVGGGKVVGQNGDNGNGGVIMVTGKGQLDLLSGELTMAANAGIARNGGVLYVGGNSVFNMYGGTICGGAANFQENSKALPLGGNVFITGSTFNMYGGTITGGTAAGGSGGNLYLVRSATFNMAGGKIDGAFELENGAKVTLSGAPVVAGTGIMLNRGTLVKLGELTKGASVAVKGNGVFTEATDKSESYVNYFAAVEEGASISVEENALFYNRPPADYKADLIFREGTQIAECPSCGKEVTWTEINQTTNGETAIAAPTVMTSHYYLSEDVTYNGTTAFITAGGIYNKVQKTTCLHLNGHNLTVTKTRAIMGSTGIFNVLGKGIVSGNNNSANNSATVHMNSQFGSGVINLYGGTYTKPADNDKGTIVFIGTNGGTINVYEEAVIDGTGLSAASDAVCVEVHGGTKEVNANQGLAAFNICGGTVKSDSGTAVQIATQYASFSMAGGEIAGKTVISNGNLLILSGAAKLSQLTVAPGMLLDVSGLTEGAQIQVDASGIFTLANEKIADVATYIKPFSQHAKLSVIDNALSCDKDYNKELEFAEDGKTAYCVVCDKDVEWTEISQTTNGTTNIGVIQVSGTHYYLSENVTYSGTSDFITAPGTNKTACLHLNGKNLTTTKSRVLLGYPGVLNVMGNGVVTGGYVGTGDWGKSTAATIHMNTTAATGTINLYGGTYTKAEESPNTTVVIHDNGGNVNVFEGAKVEGGATVYHGALNVYGADVKGEMKVITRTDGKTPAVSITDATVDSVTVTNGSFTLSGASKLSLAIAEGVKITLGEMTEGAAITVSANGVFTEANEKAGEYAKYFTAAEGAVTAQDNALVCQK